MSESPPPPGYRSGFIAVVGRPNVGKSALVNRLIGGKVTISSPVPLTTRSRIHGVRSFPLAQLIVADTPGVHQPRDQLGIRMSAATRQALTDADASVWVLDASKGLTDDDRRVVSLLQGSAGPVVAALNKAERVEARRLETLTRSVAELTPIHATIPVSAATGMNLDRLAQTLVTLLPVGPQYFPASMRTDQPEAFLIAELIREQAFALTREEVPHGLAVQIDELTPREGQDLLYIRAVLLVARLSHKKIVIGHRGQLLKRIGEQARRAIEQERGSRVYLDLWVRVSSDWRNRVDILRALYPE